MAKLDTFFAVPTSGGDLSIPISSGESVVLIGANGAGKTRLGVLIDEKLSVSGIDVHRIAAHRSLALNPNIVPPSLEIATNKLFYGRDEGQQRRKNVTRWQQKPETILLNDYEHLLAALYAENNEVSVAYRQQQRSGPSEENPPLAKIDQLAEIWKKILPHRELVVLANNLKAKSSEGTGVQYSASEMSDGERVIFYLIGQALVAKPNTVLIFDEPELHIHKSVLSKLWDEIEAARPDCAFIYISHDVEFASSRRAARKYVLRGYEKSPSAKWDIDAVPEDADLPDDVIAKIVGSRSPVLFVEGDGGSLDSAIFRRIFEEFTVIPIGNCQQVIQSVSVFAARSELHRVGCAGLIDADGRTPEEVAGLNCRGIECLPVSEVENLLLLPNAFLALCDALAFDEATAQEKLIELKNTVLRIANDNIDAASLRMAKRQIDMEVKKLDLTAKTIEELATSLSAMSDSLNVRERFASAQTELSTAIENQDYETVLRLYDNKGLLTEGAKLLGMNKSNLEEFVGRKLSSRGDSALQTALKNYLPTPTPRP